MNTPRQPAPAKDDAHATGAGRGQAREQEQARDVQPPPTGGNQGSTTAPVMKQFQKTRTESSGRS